jgi:gamma-glutamyl:cysteine ligase YbdK (ATP-grasp superfamily)
VNVLSAGRAVGSCGVGLLPAVLPCATITGIATLTNATLHVLQKKIDTKKKKRSEIMVLAQRTKNRLQKGIFGCVHYEVNCAIDCKFIIGSLYIHIQISSEEKFINIVRNQRDCILDIATFPFGLRDLPCNLCWHHLAQEQSLAKW